MNDKKTIVIVIAVLLVVIVGSIFGCKYYADHRTEKDDDKQSNNTVKVEDNFNSKIVKTVNETQKGNYLISPYSIEVALNMLRDGAKGESKEQIDKIIGERNIPTFLVKNRINVANATFIKDVYKDIIEQSYYEKLKGYDAELIYDRFETPDKINNWVNNKTYGMIPKILDSMSADFVLGIANAIAVDVKWDYKFECIDTREADFVKEDESKLKVEMMHDYYASGDVKYFETSNAKGVVLPYKAYDKDGEDVYEETQDVTRLEFVGVLPNGSVNEYINALNKDSISEIDKNAKTIDSMENTHLSLYLPRFSYDFDLKEFKDVLKKMGVNNVFDEEKADLTGIVSKENIIKAEAANLFVEKAIHKTHISLNEEGTKAAAVTYFQANWATTAAPSDKPRPEPKVIKIEFNKPFVYMVRDSKTKEVLFFGVVREPNKWEGSTCSNKEEE